MAHGAAAATAWLALCLAPTAGGAHPAAHIIEAGDPQSPWSPWSPWTRKAQNIVWGHRASPTAPAGPIAGYQTVRVIACSPDPLID